MSGVSHAHSSHRSACAHRSEPRAIPPNSSAAVHCFSRDACAAASCCQIGRTAFAAAAPAPRRAKIALNSWALASEKEEEERLHSESGVVQVREGATLLLTVAIFRCELSRTAPAQERPTWDRRLPGSERVRRAGGRAQQHEVRFRTREYKCRTTRGLPEA